MYFTQSDEIRSLSPIINNKWATSSVIIIKSGAMKNDKFLVCYFVNFPFKKCVTSNNFQETSFSIILLSLNQYIDPNILGK